MAKNGKKGVKKSRWSEEERAELRRQHEQKFHATKICIPGRTVSGIDRMLRRLGLVEAVRDAPIWSDADKARLRELKAQGLGGRRIFHAGHFPGRSIDAIQHEIGRLGLADKKASERLRKARRLDGFELKQFYEYLERYSHQKTPEEIAEHWGVHPHTVKRYQDNIGKRTSWRQTIQMPHSREKFERNGKKTTRRNRRRWKAWKKKQFARLDERAKEILEKKPNTPTVECLHCLQTWPRTTEFFYTTTKLLTKTGQHVHYVIRRCRYCGSRAGKKKKKKKV